MGIGMAPTPEAVAWDVKSATATAAVCCLVKCIVKVGCDQKAGYDFVEGGRMMMMTDQKEQKPLPSNDMLKKKKKRDERRDGKRMRR